MKGVIKMKLICSKELLLKSINTVSKAVAVRSTLPVLECILLKSDNDSLKLFANNLEMGIEASSIEADVLEGGSIALEANMFSEMIRKFSGEAVTIETSNNNITIISCGNAQFKIPGISGSDFPDIPDVSRDKKYTMLQNDLKNMIRQTIFSIAQDDTRPVLKGGFMEIEGMSISLVTVDGYRISFRKSDITESAGNISAIIPGNTLNELGKLLSSEEDETVSLYFTERHVLFDLNGNTVVSRLIDGDYIKYRQSFTLDYKTKFYINCKEFTAALERASLISREIRKKPVKLEISEGVIIISSNTELGMTYEEAYSETEGEKLTIAFNPKYLIDALKVIDDETVSLQFTTALSPCIINPVEGDKFKYLVLPLRI